MPRMIRKQIYIRKNQEKQLKQAARRRGIAEAEYIREALDRALDEPGDVPPGAPDLAAWEEEVAFLRERHATGSLPGARDWKREDLYDRSHPGRHAR